MSQLSLIPILSSFLLSPSTFLDKLGEDFAQVLEFVPNVERGFREFDEIVTFVCLVYTGKLGDEANRRDVRKQGASNAPWNICVSC